MKYIIDNDFHIHSGLSSCSSDPEQSPERILRYAEENGIRTLCLTDHFWDDLVPGASDWYAPQNFAHISQSRPLPQSEQVRFLFGCEADMDKYLTLGISRERLKEFDFIIISTTHMHMKGFTLTDEEGADAVSRAATWIRRLDAVLNMDLPFHKIGLAHLTCKLIDRNRESYRRILGLLPEDELYRLFTKAARLGVGIELNASDMRFSDEETELVLRPYRIAKKCGCKFYLGTDAHHPREFDNMKDTFSRAIDLLELTEEDKFLI